MTQTLINNRGSDELVTEAFENFKKLSKAYVDFTQKSVEAARDADQIGDLQYITVNSTEQYVHNFLNWDKFVDALPGFIKSIFSKDGKHSQADIKRMIGNIPSNYEYPSKTLEQDIKKINDMINKKSLKKSVSTGKSYTDEIRDQETYKIVKDIIENSDDKIRHKQYFDEMIKKDKQQFEYIVLDIQRQTDVTQKENIQKCYNFLIKYREQAFNLVRENLDKYEASLQKFLLKLQKINTSNNSAFNKVKGIIDQFVNYKNDYSLFYKIVSSMNDTDLNATLTRDNIEHGLIEKYNMKDTDLSLRPNIGEPINMISVKFNNITDNKLNAIFQFIKQEILEYINKNNGILVQFTKALNDADLINVDFTDMILNLYLNVIILIIVQKGGFNKQITGEPLNKQNNQIRINNRRGLDGSDVRHHHHDVGFDDDSHIKIDLSLLGNDNIIESLQPTSKILFDLLNNFFKSVYGSLFLIIQKFSTEYKNIYNLLGRARGDGTTEVTNIVINDAFGLYALFHRLHDLFVEQAFKIWFSIKNNDYRGFNLNYAQNAAGVINDDEKRQLYSIIQIKRDSKFFDIYNYLFRITTSDISMDYHEYINLINKLWSKYSDPTNNNPILPTRSQRIMSDYIQELINNMIISLKNDPKQIQQSMETQGKYYSTSLEPIFKGINNIDEMDKKQHFETTDKIIQESIPKPDKDDLLELYINLTAGIQAFTENYLNLGYNNRDYNNQQYRSNVIKSLELAKNRYLTKTEIQGKLYNIEQDESLKTDYLISIISRPDLVDIKSDFEYYYTDFGIQYRQLKEIHYHIIEILYKYHKLFVEFDIKPLAGRNQREDECQNLRHEFIEAIRYMNTQTHDELYEQYLRFVGYRGPIHINNPQNKISYIANYFMNNKRLVEVKIYLDIISQLEELIYNSIRPEQITEQQLRELPNELARNNKNSILKFLFNKQIIEFYKEDLADNYKSFPFTITPSTRSTKFVITNNYYNYFQTNLPYMKQFVTKNLEIYRRATSILIDLPYIEYQNGNINPTGLYKFLDEARESIIKEYTKQQSPYTRTELKENIKNQLNLSLDIVPVLKDIFQKYVVPPEEYYRQLQYLLQNKDINFLNVENNNTHVFRIIASGLHKQYLQEQRTIEDLRKSFDGGEFIQFTPQTIGRVEYNKIVTSETGEQSTLSGSSTVAECEILNANYSKDENENVLNVDPMLDIIGMVNTRIAKIHKVISEFNGEIPQKFKQTILQNNTIKEASQLFDVHYSDTIYSLPVNAIQTPFFMKVSQLNVSEQEKENIINHFITQHDTVDRRDVITSSLVDFIVLTQKKPINSFDVKMNLTYEQIPNNVKQAYMNIFNRIRQNDPINMNDWNAIPGFDSTFSNFENVGNNENYLGLLKNYGNDLRNGIFFGISDDQWNKLNNYKYCYLLNTFEMLRKNKLESVLRNKQDIVYEYSNRSPQQLRQITDYNNPQFKYLMYDNKFVASNFQDDNIDSNMIINNNKSIAFIVMYKWLRNQVNNVNNLSSTIKAIIEKINSDQYNKYKEDPTQRFEVVIQNGLNIPANRELQALYSIALICNQLANSVVLSKQELLSQLQNTLQGFGNNIFINNTKQININGLFANLDWNGEMNNDQDNINVRKRYRRTIELLSKAGCQISGNNIANTLGEFKCNQFIAQVKLPSLGKNETKNIITATYQKVLQSSIEDVMRSSNMLDKNIPVIYDKQTQQIIVYKSQLINTTDNSVIQMNNILALVDKQESQKSRPLSIEQKCITISKLDHIIPKLNNMIEEFRRVYPNIIDVLIVYRTACNDLLNQYLQSINVRTLFESKFFMQYFRPDDFDPSVDILQSISGGKFEGELKRAMINILLRDKSSEFLKTIENQKISPQLVKNYQLFAELKMLNDKPKFRINVEHEIVNKQFIRLAFVKRLTPRYPIIGEDHYYVVNEKIIIMPDQTVFSDIENPDENKQPQFVPDWYDRSNNKKEIIQYLLYNNVYNNEEPSKLLRLNDIRKIPFLQQYTKQQYVFSIIATETTLGEMLNDQRRHLRHVQPEIRNRLKMDRKFEDIYRNQDNQQQEVHEEVPENPRKNNSNLKANIQFVDPEEVPENPRKNNSNLKANIQFVDPEEVPEVPENTVPKEELDRIGNASSKHKKWFGQNRGGQRFRLGKPSYIIPDHFMFEINYLSGFTNRATLMVGNQITFDLMYDMNNNFTNIYGQFQSIQGMNMDFVPTIKLLIQYVYNEIARPMYQGTYTEPILFTYNCANNRFKQIREITQDLQRDRNNLQLFSILNLQPFHPIQLLKNNSMYPLLNVFNVYLSRYQSNWLNQQFRHHIGNLSLEKLNVKTNYNQEVNIWYLTRPDADIERYNPDTNLKIINNQIIDGLRRLIYYLNYNNMDYIIEIAYNGDRRITTQQQLIQIVMNNIKLENIDIQNIKTTIITQDVISRAKFVKVDNQAEANIINFDNFVNDDTVVLRCRIANEYQEDVYILIKYNGIRLRYRQFNNPEVQNNTFKSMITEIFQWMLSQKDFITRNEKNKDRYKYSQYHVFYEQ